MIVVTGATGQLGRAIVERLLDRLPAIEIVATVRDPSKASDLEARGVQIRRADFEDPSTLTQAFDGASQVLIVSGPSDPSPHRAAIEAAKVAGAEHVLYTSHQGASLHSRFAATAAHAETEQDLQSCGILFTALRNGFYAASAIQLMGQAISTGKIVVPEDGPVSWTAHADLADAAVIALTEPGRLDGITPPLTGPEALDFGDIAQVASELTRRDISRVTVSDDEWIDTMLSYGVPQAHAALLLGVFAASRNGEFAIVDATLGQLVGHGATPFRDVLATTLAGTKT
jgi:NAD(P)H dehydrogenase (quinone)